MDWEVKNQIYSLILYINYICVVLVIFPLMQQLSHNNKDSPYYYYNL